MKTIAPFLVCILALTPLLSGCSKGGDSDVNVTAQIEQLKSADKDAQINACVELGKAGEAAAPAVPALIPLLKDKDPEIRRLAAYALMSIGPKASAALPGVKQLLGDPDQNVAMQAVNTLRALDPKAADIQITNVMSNP